MLYESKCDICGTVHEFYCKASELKDSYPVCCDIQTHRYFSPQSTPQIASSTARVFENYKCPETGVVVTSDRQRNEILAKHNLIDARETGTGKDHIKRAKKRAAKLKQDDSVSTQYTELSTT